MERAGSIGVGLIGTGEFGRYLLESLDGLRGYRLAAVARGRKPAVAEQVAEAYHAEAVDGLEGLLAHPGVDAVLISTPPAQHARQALAALSAGKHVFGEKPLATTLADADEMIATAARAGLVVAVDYVMRWNPLYVLLQRIQGQLGRLTHFGLRNYGSIEGLAPDHWFWDEQLSAGIFIEHGVHFFDAYRQLAGGVPRMVAGVRYSTVDGRGPNDVALAMAVGPGDASATFLHSFTKPEVSEHCELSLDWERARAEVTGWLPVTLDLRIQTDAAGEAAIREVVDAGAAALAVPGYEPTKGEDLRLERVHADGDRRDVHLWAELGDEDEVYRSSVRAAMADFIDAIRTGRPPKVPAADARPSLRMAVLATNLSFAGPRSGSA